MALKQVVQVGDSKRPDVVDATTGEVLEHGFTAVLFPKTRSPFGTRFLTMAQDAISTLAKQRKDLGEEGFAVFLAMVGQMSYENHILVPQAELAKELGMQRPNVSRAIRKLLDLGVIEKGPKVGRVHSYKLSSSYGWKGSARNHVIALDQERKRRMAAAGISGVIDGGTKEAEASAERDPNTLDMFESHQ